MLLANVIPSENIYYCTVRLSSINSDIPYLAPKALKI